MSIIAVKNGDHYWVYAHVTPSWNNEGKVSGFHSNRRVPDQEILQNHVIPLYEKIRTAEKSGYQPKGWTESRHAGHRFAFG